MSLAGWRANVTRKTNIRPCARIKLTAGGGYYYYSNGNFDVYERTTGKWFKLSGGLISELSYDQAISIWQRSSEINETDIEIADPNLLDLVKADPILISAEVELSFVAPKEIDWEDRYVILRGTLRYPEWGTASETIKFRVSPINFRTDLRFPPLVINETRWPNAPDKNLGEESYPILYGEIFESYCPYVDTSTYKYLIAGHDINTAPNKFELVNFDNISRQEVFSSECGVTTDFDCETAGVGTWLAAGVLQFHHTANATGYAWLIDSAGNHILAYNQIMKAKVCFITPAADTKSAVGFLFRYTDSNNFYYAYVGRDFAGNTNIYVGKLVGGASTNISTVPLVPINLDAYFQLDVRADGNRISVFIDEVELVTIDDPSFPVSGMTCLYIYHLTAGTDAYVNTDWVMFPVHEPVCSNTTDGEGNSVYIADFADNLGKDTEVYCSNGIGKEDAAGVAITDFGSAFFDMVENYSDLTADDIDSVGLAAAASALSSYICSIKFNGRSDIFESISERLSKQTPLIPLWREGKFSAIVLDYSRVDISAYPIKPGSVIDREGRIQNSPVEDIGNIFTIKYQYSAIQNRFLKKIVRDRTNSPACALSHAKFGRREWSPVECYDIIDDATANLFGDFLAMHYSYPQLIVPYSFAKDLHWLTPDCLVKLTDLDVGFADKKFIIEQATPFYNRLFVVIRSIE